ncbi:MAG TPA: hypothetical protein PLE74_03770 [Candidatus Cloacimonadota bacterium]|nr:hypothetical protein [Candidatus Cloacimonadota bacterium]HPT71377.1 hypothetical protein [Candidatus Cloacimonadota bacterium]
MAKGHFDILLLLGRPASGKSEIIDFVKKLNPIKRSEYYHLGELKEIDDFPMLWTWFEEDDILSREMGKTRMHTYPDGMFLFNYQWDLLIRRMNMEYQKQLRDTADFHSEYTTLIEFSRGSEHGGYKSAFSNLSDEILKRAAILYVDVTYEESVRKNQRRFNPDKPDSILEHGLPMDKMEKLYKEIDWQDVIAGNPTHIMINNIPVPYVVFNNMPEKTDSPDKLAQPLLESLDILWKLKNQ